MRENAVEHKCAGAAGGHYLSRMISRALTTALLALLAWIPFGQAQARAGRAAYGESALSAASALDVAADSPSHVSERTTFRRDSAPPAKQRQPRIVTDGGICRGEKGPGASARSSNTRERERQWRGFPRRRLIVPHDATAPPTRIA